MQNTIIKISNANGKTQIDIIGSIDENFNQYTKEIPKAGHLDFNLQSLKSINSTGIREWIKLMQTVSRAQVSFNYCPKIFIDQVNMVSGFIPANGKVLSFYVPYYNEDLDSECLVLYKFGENYTASSVTVQDEYKDEKGTAFELDVVKVKYFKFLQAI